MTYDFGSYDLVSQEAVTGNLMITYDSISKTNNTIVFNSFAVMRIGDDGKPIEPAVAGPRDVRIRVIS